MFNFFKKHKPLESDEELKISVKERALKAFLNIEGLDDRDDVKSFGISWASSHIVDRATSFSQIIIHARDREIDVAKQSVFYRRRFNNKSRNTKIHRSFEKTGVVPAIYDKGTHYVTNHKLILEILKEISDSGDVRSCRWLYRKYNS
jgi:hypothetical protein